jgi:acetyl-CoA carboxylase carboxyltransferase component
MDNKAESIALGRIKALLDENSFVEIGSNICSRALYFDDEVKSADTDGVVTGYGLIEGNVVYIYSQDPDILGGSIGEMHSRKIISIYELAIKTGAPVIGLIDSKGIRLSEGMDALHSFGKIYLKQALASGVIPQISCIFGQCAGGMQISSIISDFIFMKDSAKMFLNAPNTIENNKNNIDTSTTKFHEEMTGIVDFSGTEREIISEVRRLVKILPSDNESDVLIRETSDDLNRISEEIESFTLEPIKLLREISDDNFIFELRKKTGTDMLVAFIKLNGKTVGVVSNNQKKLTTAGCNKAEEFIKFCNCFNIPILTITNSTGFKEDFEEEISLARAAAGLLYGFANAAVPKINLIVGKVRGNIYNLMNAKSIGADLVFAWKNADISLIDSENAVRIIYGQEIEKENDKINFIKEKKEEYEKIHSPLLFSAKRGYVDIIIKADETRKYLISGFEILYSKHERRPIKKHGTI